MTDASNPTPALLPRPRPGWRFLFAHPAHLVALGFGSGLAPVAPGTAGTLWAWAAFVLLRPFVPGELAWGGVMLASAFVGWWACTVAARNLGIADPGAVVWDEVLGFWLVLWLVMPASLLAQAVAFALFRVFDAAKPGPVAWADQRFKLARGMPIGWAQGFGILLDDLVAAVCTLLVIAIWRFVFP